MRNLRIKHLFARIQWRRVFVLSLCFAFLAGTTLNASAYDLTKVKNKSFEKDKNKNGIPDHWTGVNRTDKDKRVCNRSKHKKCSYKMVADGGVNALTQVAKFSSGPAGIIATVSGWMKGKDLAGAGTSYIYMRFNQTDGGTQLCAAPLFLGGTFGWTKRSGDCVALEPFNSMTMYLYTNEASGRVWFDKVKLKAVAP